MKKITSNKIFQWILKIIFTLLFVYIVNKNVLAKLNTILNSVTWQHISAAFFLSFAGLFFQVKRWEIILRFQNFPVNNYIPWKTILWGNLLAIITPGRVGEIFRGLEISKDRKTDSLFAVIIDKLFIIFTVLLTGLICILSIKWFLHIAITKEIKIFIITAFVVCSTGLFILFTGTVFDKKHAVTRYFNRVLKNIPRLFAPAGRRALVYSLAAHICLISQTVILLSMFGCKNILINSSAVGLAYGVMPFLSFTIGNMGVREGSFSFFLSYIGTETHNNTLSIEGISLGTSIIILFMNIVLPAFIGLMWYLLDSFRTKIIKSL
jgi:hypothetical protein